MVLVYWFLEKSSRQRQKPRKTTAVSAIPFPVRGRATGRLAMCASVANLPDFVGRLCPLCGEISSDWLGSHFRENDKRRCSQPIVVWSSQSKLDAKLSCGL